jgi:hypothetical protein
MKYILSAAFTFAVAQIPQVSHAEMFSSGHAQGTCISNEGGIARIRGCVEDASSQAVTMTWIARENVFYGPLKIGGLCLQDNDAGRPLTFALCNNSKRQEWKLSGNGRLNSGLSLCADIERGARNDGATIISWTCTGGSNQIWWNESYRRAKVMRISNMGYVPVGTRLEISGRALINPATGQVVAQDVSRIIAAGGGNIIAAGSGNIIASGALN